MQSAPACAIGHHGIITRLARLSCMGATTLNVSERIERLLHGGFHRLLHEVSHGEILAALTTRCNPSILLCPYAHCQSMSSLTVTVTALLTSRNTDVIVKRHQELVYPAPTCLPGQGGSRKRMRPTGNQAGNNEPSRCGGFFIGRIYSYLPCPDRRQNG